MMSYGGQSNLMMEVLTEQVPPEFLAYLDDLGIPYLFAGKKEVRQIAGNGVVLRYER